MIEHQNYFKCNIYFNQQQKSTLSFPKNKAPASNYGDEKSTLLTAF